MKTIITAIAIFLSMSNIAFSTNRRDIRQNIIIQQKVVELQFPFEIQSFAVPASSLGLDYYYKVATKQYVTLDDPTIQKLSNTIVDNLLKNFEEKQPTEEEKPIPAKQPDKPSGPEKPPIPGDDNDTISLDGRLYDAVSNIIIKKCSACHDESNSTNGRVFVKNGILSRDLPLKKLWSIWDRVDGSHLPREKLMPKNGEPLLQEEVDLIREYVRQHAN